MIQRLVNALSQDGYELSYDQILDSLWLSLQLPRQESSPSARASKAEIKRGSVESLPAKLDDHPPPAPPNIEAGTPGTASNPRPGELFVPNPGALNSIQMRAAPVRVPAAESLPNKYGLNAALRPLKRRYPSSRTKVLDVTATVEQISNGGPAIPILKAAPERWLNVALIVDESASMRVWRETIQELAILLTRHGSFRDVRSWYVNLDGPSMKLYSEPGLPGSPRRLRHPKELIDVSGRRLILVASDCVSAGWRGGAMASAILDWGRRGPLALLQMLPERLWAATALGDSVTRFRAYSAGAPNSSLETQRLAFDFSQDSTDDLAKSESVALPVVNLEGWSVAPWVKLVANLGDATAEGVTVRQIKSTPANVQRTPEARGGEGPAKIEKEPAPSLSAIERVARFRGAASPAARQLAGFLSVAPLCLPVMRLVQKAMMPMVRQVDLAEVLLGGLLQQVTPANEVGRAEDVFYEFFPGVRELLQESVSQAAQQGVLREVSRLIENQAGTTIDFSALLSGDPSALGSLALYPLGQRFAEIASPVVARLGWTTPKPAPVVVPDKKTPLSVLVVGTGSFDLPRSVQFAAEQVGAAVASASANLITGGWAGVDHVAARSFSEAQGRGKKPPVGELLQIVEGRQAPDFKGGKVERVGLNEGIAECVKRADLVILIGGAGGTWLAFQRALEMNKLVLPFLNTGTDAQHAAILLELFGQNVPLKLVQAGFENEREATGSGHSLQRLLYDLKIRRSALGIDNHDLLWLTNKILPLADNYLAKENDFEGEADAIYNEFRANTLPEDQYAGMVLAMQRDATPSWRTVAYLAIQAKPSLAFVDTHLAALETEIQLGFNGKETRPLWRWLVAADSLMTSFSDAFPKESVRSLVNAQQRLRQRSDVDPGGECRVFLGRLVEKLEGMVSVRDTSGEDSDDEVIEPVRRVSTKKAPAKKVVASEKRATVIPISKEVVPEKRPVVAAKKAATKKAVAKKAIVPAQKAPVQKAPAKKAPAKKVAAKKAPPKSPSVPKKSAVPAKKATAKRAVSNRAPAKKAAVKKAAAKKVAAKAPARKFAKKAPAKRKAMKK
jgi:hypothetical protein